MDVKRLPIRLELGKYYIVGFSYNTQIICKFIQTTKCGFNFLNVETNKCLLKHHLYPSKCDNHLSGDWFWLNSNMKVKSSN